MKLAKNALDIGLYTNNIDPQLAFWRDQAHLEYSELLKVGGGTHQHRHAIGDSVLKVNHVRDPLPQSAPSGIRTLWIVSAQVDLDTALADPDGNRLMLLPSAQTEVTQLRIDLEVSHLASHQDFYGNTCRFPELTTNVFAVGKSQIHLVEAEVAQQPEQKALGFRYMTVQVFDVKSEHQHVITHGGSEGLAPVKLGDTAHISFVRDPDGNWMEISQRKSITGSLD